MERYYILKILSDEDLIDWWNYVLPWWTLWWLGVLRIHSRGPRSLITYRETPTAKHLLTCLLTCTGLSSFQKRVGNIQNIQYKYHIYSQNSTWSQEHKQTHTHTHKKTPTTHTHTHTHNTQHTPTVHADNNWKGETLSWMKSFYIFSVSISFSDSAVGTTPGPIERQ